MVSPSVQLPGDPSDVEASSQTRQNAPALRARGFQPIASFALSYSQDDMHPCITPAEQSHFTGWVSCVEGAAAAHCSDVFD